MGHSDLIVFFLQIGFMLAVALACGQVMRRLHQPTVVGELIGGILLGPTVLGLLLPDLYRGIFPAEGATVLARKALIELGLLFFLFVAGLEVNLAHVRRQGVHVALTSFFSILLPMVLGVGTVILMPGLWQSPSMNNDIHILAVFMGVALSISALPVIVRILMDLNLLHNELGIVIIAAATVNDLIGWTLFALILSTLDASAGQNHWQTIGAVLAFSAFVILVGSRVAPFIIQWPKRYMAWPSGLIATITVVVLLAAAAAESIGVHAVFGAFLVGIAFGQGIEKENQAHETIYQFAISFFAPLYFVSVGLQTNFVANFDWTIVLVVLIIACVGKIAGAGIGARMGGMPLRESLAVGFGMNARGAMEMVLASLALEAGLIDQRIYVALVVMAMVTSLLSGPAMQYLLRHAKNRQELAAQPPVLDL